jgi:hypothetical protein
MNCFQNKDRLTSECLQEKILYSYEMDTDFTTDLNSKSFYLNWLENDLMGFLNNDKPMRDGFEDSFVQFMHTIPDLTLKELVSCINASGETVPKLLKAMSRKQLCNFLFKRENNIEPCNNCARCGGFSGFAPQCKYWYEIYLRSDRPL